MANFVDFVADGRGSRALGEAIAETTLKTLPLIEIEPATGHPEAGSSALQWWRRGESNPRPKRPYVEILHAQSRLVISSPRFQVGTARRDDQPETSRTSPSDGGLRSQPGFLNRTSERSRLALRAPSRLKPRVRVRCRWQLNFAVVFTRQTACSACSSIVRCPVETGSPPRSTPIVPPGSNWTSFARRGGTGWFRRDLGGTSGPARPGSRRGSRSPSSPSRRSARRPPSGTARGGT